MKKNMPTGTAVTSHDGMDGTIMQNRTTIPDLDRRFDYVVKVMLHDGEALWGYAASELTVT